MKTGQPRKVLLAGFVFGGVKLFFAILLLAAPLASAKPETKTLEWRPACDGAAIEVSSENQRIQKVSASAFHSLVIVEWEIEYGDDGLPAKVTFLEFERGRITEGEEIGGYSGINKLKRSQVWRLKEGKIAIDDEELREDFDDILRRANAAE